MTDSTAVHHARKVKRALPWIGVIGLVAFALVPFYIPSEYLLRVVNMIILYSILAISLQVIMGLAGQLSFGHAAFYGVGAYVAALLMLNTDVPYLLVVVASGAAAGAVGLLVGIPVARFKGHFLALVTMGFGQIFFVIVNNWMSVTKGPAGLPGIPSPTIFGIVLDTNTDYFYLGLVLAAITMGFVMLLSRSYAGRALKGLREQEVAATAMGINVRNYKLMATVVGTFFAGVAGAFMAPFVSFVGPGSFTLDMSILIAMMVIIGGLGSLWGSVIGAALIVILIQLLAGVPGLQMLAVGVILVGVLLVRPQGLMGKAFIRGSSK